MGLFNLIDFLYTDIIQGKDCGHVHSNKILQLLHFRYHRVAALEIMDDVMVGETTDTGVPYTEFVARDAKMLDVMFNLLQYGPQAKSDLTELHVSHGGGLSGTARRRNGRGRRTSIPFSKSSRPPYHRRPPPRPTMSMARLYEGLPRQTSRRSTWGAVDAAIDDAEMAGASLYDPAAPAPGRSFMSGISLTKTGSPPRTAPDRTHMRQLTRLPKVSDELRRARSGVSYGAEAATPLTVLCVQLTRAAVAVPSVMGAEGRLVISPRAA
jgi:hypothetical protein